MLVCPLAHRQFLVCILQELSGKYSDIAGYACEQTCQLISSYTHKGRQPHLSARVFKTYLMHLDNAAQEMRHQYEDAIRARAAAAHLLVVPLRFTCATCHHALGRHAVHLRLRSSSPARWLCVSAR